MKISLIAVMAASVQAVRKVYVPESDVYIQILEGESGPEDDATL